MSFRWKKSAALTLVLATLAPRLWAQRPLPVVVSAVSVGAQLQPAAVTDTLNRLLVAWRDSTGAGQSVLLQGFDTWGGRTGPTTAVSAVVTGGVSAPSVGASFLGVIDTAVVGRTTPEQLAAVGLGNSLLFAVTIILVPIYLAFTWLFF